METCTTVLGQTASLEPILCSETGIRIGEVVKCKKHWAKSRQHRDSLNDKKKKDGYKKYQRSDS
jgi:hypothetical protein